MAEWRKSHSVEMRKQSKKWRKSNKDYDQQRKQEWYLKNKERVGEKGREWRKNNPLYILERSLKKTYGITLEKYNQLLEKQNGCCAICHRSPEALPKRLGVDHNHSNGEIRGLLCYECNYGLGYFKDNPLFLMRAAEYVK